MDQTDDASKWEIARLIPVSGIRNAEEQERRATSALLAVLYSVSEFGVAFTKPFGAPKGQLDTFIETPFELADERKVRPDGLIRVTRGKKEWIALLEVKTGTNELEKGQIEDYLVLAKEQRYNCVITISNQIAKIPGEHPVEVDKRKTRTISLHHLSWSKVLTEAMLQKNLRGVVDPDQAWILDELIRYMRHPNAGAVDFCDMGEEWVGVRDDAPGNGLRTTQKGVVEVAGKWEELVSFAALRLGRKINADVQEVLSSKERNDISIRIDNIVDEMVERGVMPGEIRIPNTVDDVSFEADLRARQIVVSINIKAPTTGRQTTKINWLLKQLKSVSDPNSGDIRIDSWGVRSRTSMSDLLKNVRQKQSLLIPVDNREIGSFRVSISKPMGLKRSAGKQQDEKIYNPKSFIDSVLMTIDQFYGDVVEHLKDWQPPAPKLSVEPTPMEALVDEVQAVDNVGGEKK